jgi:hypothetical protein
MPSWMRARVQGSGQECVLTPDHDASWPVRVRRKYCVGTHRHTDARRQGSVNEHRILHSRYTYSLGRYQRKPQSFFYLVLAVAGGVVAACVHIMKHPDLDTWDFMSIALVWAHFFVLACKHQAYKHERLSLTPERITYWSPLPRLLRWQRLVWSLQWTDVRSATLLPPGREPNLTRLDLELETKGRKRWLMPLQWVDPRGDDQLPESRLADRLLGSTAQELRDTLLNTPIVQHLKALHIPLNLDAVAQRDSVPFALDAHPHSRAALLLILGTFFYLNTETISAREIYVAGAFWVWYIGIGCLAAGLATLWLHWARVPTGESLGLAMILGVVLAIALFPGALRLNQLTDTKGLRPYTYVLQPDRSLEPRDQALPTVRLERYYEYWQRLEPGSVSRVYLRRGGLGFYQVDLRPFDALATRFDE